MLGIAELRVKIEGLEAALWDEPESIKKEARRNAIVQAATEAADTFIMEFSEGTLEETDYLTAAVAKAFADKVHHRMWSALLNYDMTGKRKQG